MIGMGMSGGLAFMLVCTAVGIALIAGVVWLVLRLVPATGRRPPGRHELERDEDDPFQILRRRYAVGEIDEDEYLQRLSGLSQQ